MFNKYRKETLYSKTIVFFFSLIPIALIVGTGVSEAIIILLSLIFLTNFIIYKNFNKKLFNLLFLLIFLWFCLLINYIYSIDKENSLLRNILFFKYIIFIIGSLNFFLNKRNTLSIVLFVWSIILILFSVDVLYQFIFKENIFGIETKYKNIRLSGFMGDELKAGTLITGLGFSSTLFFFYNIKRKMLISFIIFFLVFIVFLTNERSIFIKLLSILIPLIFFIKKEDLIKYSIFFLALISIITLLTIERESSFKRRYIDNIFIEIKNNNYNIFEFINKTEYGKHRLDAIKLYKKFPLTGVGNKNFRILCKKNDYDILKSHEFNNSICTTHPHQFYYEILSEHGLIGIACFVILILILIIDFYKHFSKNKNIYNLFLFLLILSFFYPLLPSGSFFTSFNATIFWINFILYFYSRTLLRIQLSKI